MYVHLYRRARRHAVGVHTLVCRAFHGRRPSARHKSCHRSGDKLDNRQKNLKWATQSENQLDRVKHDTHSRGERAWNARLMRSIILWARRKVKREKIAVASLARSIGIPRETLRDAINGKSWGWLK